MVNCTYASRDRASDEAGTRSYAYNHAGRMIQFTESSVLQADYTVNAQGQRVKTVRHVGASDYVRHFFYDQAGRLIGEYRDNPDGSYAYVDYVWLNNAPVVQEERSFDSSDVLTGTQTTWLHVDHLNTPRVGTDDSQTIVWRWDSDPFGVGAADSDPDNDSTDHVVLLRFPGQYEDEESGHYYNYFRDYDAITGRYIQSDPIGLFGGMNAFAYAEGSPIRFADEFGLATTCDGHVECLAAMAASRTMQGAVNTAGAGVASTLTGQMAEVNTELSPAAQAALDADADQSCPTNGKDPCKGLRDQLKAHQQKLRTYANNPLGSDNRGHLRDALAGGNVARAQHIYDRRVASLVH